MYIQRTRDFNAGLLFMGFGVGAMTLSRAYTMGDAAEMGPGYFPFALGGLLTLLGLLTSLRSLSRGKGTREAHPFSPRPMLLVLLSVVLFCLLLRPLGLLLSTVILVVVASMASTEFRKGEALLNALVLLGLVLFTFVVLLKFQIPVLPAFLFF